MSALRRHASSGGSGGLYAGWDIDESPSQKAWRPRNHGPAVERLEAAGGTAEKEKALRELVGAVAASGGADAGDGSDGSAAPGAGTRRGFYGDPRSDRHDSTIGTTEDYVSFLEWRSGDRSAPYAGTGAGGRRRGAEKEEGVRDDAPARPEELDEEGRPLSALVLYFRARNAEATSRRRAEQKRKDAARKEERRRKDKARKASRKDGEQGGRNKKERRGRKKQQGGQGRGGGQAAAAQPQPQGKPVVLAKKPEGGGGAGGILPPSSGF